MKQEGCVGRKEMDASHQRSNILVLGDIRRIFNSTAGGGVGYHRTSEENNEGDGDAWDLRAPNVLSGVIDTPQEVQLPHTSRMGGVTTCIGIDSFPQSSTENCVRPARCFPDHSEPLLS